jgi:hypothetical protein
LIAAARNVKGMGFMGMVRRRWVKGKEGQKEREHEVIQIEH